MYYVYVLREEKRHHFYIGFTNDLNRRLVEHKSGQNISTHGRFWKLYCYFVFSNKEIAQKFEKYLKSGSGRSFTKKHFEFKIDETHV